MHESVRRRWCRLAFLALCLIPTALVVGLAVERLAPGHVRRHELRLAERLGLTVSLDGLEHLRPGSVLYSGLRLSDPETGAVLLHCRLLEMTETDTTVVLRASQPEVFASRAQRLWQLIERRLRLETGPAPAAVRALAGQLTWRLDDDTDQPGHTFVEVDARIVGTAEGDEAQASFRLAGIEMPQTATLRIVRRRQSGVPVTNVTLHTGPAALPGTIFAPLVDASRWFGRSAAFQGMLWAESAPQGWHGEITGRIYQADLDRLVTDRFPHHLSGRANVQIDRALIRHGRIEEAAGSMAAGPGQVGRSLLAAGVELLGLESGGGWPDTSILPFDRLAFDFVLGPRGLLITGRCPGYQRAVMVSGDRVYWHEPRQPAPVVSLVRVLVPDNTVQVPATRQTDWLIRSLPVPDVLPSGAAALPEARLRLGSARPEPDVPRR